MKLERALKLDEEFERELEQEIEEISTADPELGRLSRYYFDAERALDDYWRRTYEPILDKYDDLNDAVCDGVITPEQKKMLEGQFGLDEMYLYLRSMHSF